MNKMPLLLGGLLCGIVLTALTFLMTVTHTSNPGDGLINCPNYIDVTMNDSAVTVSAKVEEFGLPLRYANNTTRRTVDGVCAASVNKSVPDIEEFTLKPIQLVADVLFWGLLATLVLYIIVGTTPNKPSKPKGRKK